ncbi:MAG TPA: tRNA (adenosine(37)-N6)-threonylcarbamoyltransferase complex ATPase subunit type 1 TsaE [Bacilli bacterium]|nr:tRNA (adenosine(37)-N6)-threonylcarbamoyltransferase complex ATPase subunit type 1 TsaE [Bacilli bacterium]
MTIEFISKSREDTKALAATITALLKSGDVVLLYGDLGAGKTTFVQGVAQKLQIIERVNSPTFNILKLYFKGKRNMFHIDAYRLENNQEEIGLDEYIGANGITLIEWPNHIAHLLPKEHLKVTITYVSLNERLIKISGTEAYLPILKNLVEKLK